MLKISQKIVSRFTLATGVFVLSLAFPAYGEEEPSVTPYRPTVSNPAQLSYPGWLEIESGWNRTKANDNSWRNNLPYTLKLAFNQDFGIMLGGDAYIAQTDLTGARLSGSGDTLLLIKQRWDGNENSAFGVEYGVKTATAKVGLGSGKTDYIVNGIYSTELNGHTIDLNLGITQLGIVQVNERKQQLGWATTWSRGISDEWTLGAELSGSARQGTPPVNQFLVAASYATSRRVVWDFGVAAGTSNAAQKWNAFFGVAFLAGKVF